MMTSPSATPSATRERVEPPRAWGRDTDDFLRVLLSPWHRLVIELGDVLTRATVEFSHRAGLRATHLPLTTRTVTCPTGVGSDSEPVPVDVGGIQTFLADSAQFLLEYGCRLAPGGCYCILPSFRAEKPDATHLSQFVHSEAEIPGGLDDLIAHVEAYVRFLAARILHESGSVLADAIGDVGHLERMAGSDGAFARLTFREAVSLLSDDPGFLNGAGGAWAITRRGEQRLLDVAGEFVWITHFDHLSVPFFQAFADDGHRSACNADLLFGVGEVVGGGERHATGTDVRTALRLHKVPESDYSWYARMKDRLPMRTSGFGLGMERFLLWVLRHEDIRDIPFVSRIDEELDWPSRVERP